MTQTSEILVECIWDADAVLGEGPVWVAREQALYWVDIKGDKIHRLTLVSGARTTWAPFVMLLVLAGLVSVPDYLYEAAAVDRASWWRRFKTVTFPYVKGLLLLALLFRTIETFKIFDVVYIITAGGPGTSTETIAVYVYKVAFQFFKTSQSSALSYILLFVVIVLTNLYLYFVNRRNEEV